MPANISKRHNIAFAAHQQVTRRIAELMRERAQLEEEILQLRVAVKIWTAVAEQAAAGQGGAQNAGGAGGFACLDRSQPLSRLDA